MIFSCGETYEHWIKRLSNWHKWFAWHPVHIHHNGKRWLCAWLQTVSRKGHNTSVDGELYGDGSILFWISLIYVSVSEN